MSPQQGVTDPTNSDPATPKPSHTHDLVSGAPAVPTEREPAPVSLLRKMVLGTFTIAMITAVLLGIIVVVGQIVGVALGSPGVVTFFAEYPSKVAFFAAGIVCVTSLISHYFPGAAALETDDH